MISPKFLDEWRIKKNRRQFYVYKGQNNELGR